VSRQHRKSEPRMKPKDNTIQIVEAIAQSRRTMVRDRAVGTKRTLEGGCGVIGIIGSDKLKGNCIIRPCEQMRNRGNGKGGGVAAVGLFDEYKNHYALHIAFLDDAARDPVEKDFVESVFEVAHAEKQINRDDQRETGLEIKPPLVWRYFVRVKPEKLEPFAEKNSITEIGAAENEFVFQNSFRLNAEYYENRKDPKAFVLSHGRDLMILKGVGYAEEIARYYCLEETQAHLWIGHQRYPTRGRVWHPGGAHPFVGLHEALVHNGDFANYHAVCEYLRQWGVVPQFITDTEVSVLLFDLYTRVLGYPLEFAIESLAPTPEGDFERLSKRRQRIFRAIQSAHLHGSPDGPWFFIVARAEPETGAPQLIGITDVSMLRPQVFCLREGDKSFGAIASEKQALDAFFEEISYDDPQIPPMADRYWAARGGSCTDGGAFVYTIKKENGKASLEVQDKFGNRVRGQSYPGSQKGGGVPSFRLERQIECRDRMPDSDSRTSQDNGIQELDKDEIDQSLDTAKNPFQGLLKVLMTDLQSNRYENFEHGVNKLVKHEGIKKALGKLSVLRDRHWNPGEGQRTFQLAAVEKSIRMILDSVPEPGNRNGAGLIRLDAHSAWGKTIPKPGNSLDTMVIDAGRFPNDGPEAVSRALASFHALGWRNFIVYRCRGDRFIGCGLGPNTDDVRIDVYGEITWEVDWMEHSFTSTATPKIRWGRFSNQAGL
jgi:glutamate synthase domain-containing protein 1